MEPLSNASVGVPKFGRYRHKDDRDFLHMVPCRRDADCELLCGAHDKTKLYYVCQRRYQLYDHMESNPNGEPFWNNISGPLGALTSAPYDPPEDVFTHEQKPMDGVCVDYRHIHPRCTPPVDSLTFVLRSCLPGMIFNTRAVTRTWRSSHRRRRNARKLSFSTPLQRSLLTYAVRVYAPLQGQLVRRVLLYVALHHLVPCRILVMIDPYAWQSVEWRRADRAVISQPSRSIGWV